MPFPQVLALAAVLVAVLAVALFGSPRRTPVLGLLAEPQEGDGDTAVERYLRAAERLTPEQREAILVRWRGEDVSPGWALLETWRSTRAHRAVDRLRASAGMESDRDVKRIADALRRSPGGVDAELAAALYEGYLAIVYRDRLSRRAARALYLGAGAAIPMPPTK